MAGLIEKYEKELQETRDDFKLGVSSNYLAGKIEVLETIIEDLKGEVA